MNQNDMAFLQQIYDAFAKHSFSDILLALFYAIVVLAIGSVPLFWLLKRQFANDKNEFEHANTHLQGQYFSFWKWLYLRNDCGNISNKSYKDKFGDKNYINTDSALYTFKKLFSKYPKLAIVWVFIIIGIVIFR